MGLPFILRYHLKIFPLFLGILFDPFNHSDCLSGNLPPCPNPFLIVIVLKISLYLWPFNHSSPVRLEKAAALCLWPLARTSKVCLKLRTGPFEPAYILPFIGTSNKEISFTLGLSTTHWRQWRDLISVGFKSDSIAETSKAAEGNQAHIFH